MVIAKQGASKAKAKK